MKKLNLVWGTILCSFLSLTMTKSDLLAQNYDTEEVSMMRGVTQNIKNGWTVDPIFTVGETDNDGTDYALDRFGYRPPGVMDGMYAWRKGNNKVDLFVNHELRDERGYPYTLANGTELTGARVTKFRVRQQNGQFVVKSAELAYDRIVDRYYNEVTDQSQLDEGANPGSMDGIDRLCSANGIERFKYGFRDDVFLTGEETGNGQEFALDIKNGVLYCAPAMGRAAWESVTVMQNFYSNKVVVLIGDDRGGAPLLLYIGEKNRAHQNNAPGFLKRNGLAKGNLFVWVADNGDLTPEDWNGTGTSRSGKFVKIDHYQPNQAGNPGFDDVGYADMETQDDLKDAIGGFSFSRPEDVATNPNDGTQAVMASTGRSSLFPSDAWGTTYLVDIDAFSLFVSLWGPLDNINNIPAELTVLYDGDDSGAGQFPSPDYGMRSPDNLEWADDGYIYLNEDRSIGGFCLDSGVEASVWQLNPDDGELTRILEMDRNAVPFAQTDSAPGDCGNWESSGVVDLTSYFSTAQNETLLLLNVQGHSNDNAANPNSPIGGDDDLSEGGQLIFASNFVESRQQRAPTYGFSIPEKDIVEGVSLVAFPNPTTDYLSLSIETGYKIYDVLGTLVMEGEQTKSINMSNLSPGIYFLESTSGETIKVIKQ